MRLTLSQPLISAYADYCHARFTNGPFGHEPLAAVHEQLAEYENRILYVSSLKDYFRLISFVYSKDNRGLFISFNEEELDKLQSAINNYDVERSKLYSLLLSSFLFSSGERPLAANDFLSFFSSGKPDYKYQLYITEDIYNLYADTCRDNIEMTTLVRAAVFYYANVAPDEFRVTKSPSVAVTNSSANWKKFFIRGSHEFKKRLFDLKKSTGNTINLIVNNALYQFLSNIKENQL